MYTRSLDVKLLSSSPATGYKPRFFEAGGVASALQNNGSSRLHLVLTTRRSQPCQRVKVYRHWPTSTASLWANPL
ncbi:hypothetical protein Cob_v009547 [Colletotrichum orbiculare MAFF 240422]|uniref:Uncharacterized protein n=1 Tax=Colletotrichum orbiculare (strain 104-T / ATCC 96160 / CBS 514.97 / LARS 414 / MAFF 240422) TaxID=1213857 RepID=A0A484FHY9_COLOR|nr:hypothetical protein Cob_v009547 [Colletotrichum orbiculare MAFF 240422]